MIELKGIKKLLYKLLKVFGFIEEKQITKREMCERVKKQNICSGDCDSCIWGVGND